jgi:DNA-binding CsgD family transcriptional regulator
MTKREGEVVSLICEGLTNREISEAIFISEYTVKVHIKNIMKKMKATSKNEIIALLK